jgi:hypothetical protein
MGTYVKPKQKRNPVCAKWAEISYVEDNLNYFINKNKKSTRTNQLWGWKIEEDHDTLLRQKQLSYITENFNLYELYVVFFNPSLNSIFSSKNDYERSSAITTISKDDSFTAEEAKRLKRKIWDMHPIFFGMIHEFINNSDLFWDREKETTVYPHWTDNT